MLGLCPSARPFKVRLQPNRAFGVNRFGAVRLRVDLVLGGDHRARICLPAPKTPRMFQPSWSGSVLAASQENTVADIQNLCLSDINVRFGCTDHASIAHGFADLSTTKPWIEGLSRNRAHLGSARHLCRRRNQPVFLDACFKQIKAIRFRLCSSVAMRYRVQLADMTELLFVTTPRCRSANRSRMLRPKFYKSAHT